MTVNKRGLLADEGDVGVGENALDTCTELGHHLGHALTSFSESGRVDVGLRGDTADIETGASDVLALEDRDLQTLFRSIFSSAVATWNFGCSKSSGSHTCCAKPVPVKQASEIKTLAAIFLIKIDLFITVSNNTINTLF